MKTVFINGSPKKSLSASSYLAAMQRLFVMGNKVTKNLRNKNDYANIFEELKAAMQDLAGAYQAELVIEDNEIGFEIDGIYISVQYEPGDEDPYLVICKDPEVGVDQSFRSIQEAMDYIETLADTFFDIEEEDEE